jgi:hypothetical protein
MTKSKTGAILAGLLAATIDQTREKDSYLQFTNPYAGFPKMSYSGNARRVRPKAELTNKQRKSRAKAKNAKQARKRNR